MSPFDIREPVTVPSGMGGVWDCFVLSHNEYTKSVTVKINNKQHPGFHNQIYTVPEDMVRKVK